MALIVNGFVRDVLQHLPMEFMAETQKLISISLEGSVGWMDTERKGVVQGVGWVTERVGGKIVVQRGMSVLLLALANIASVTRFDRRRLIGAGGGSAPDHQLEQRAALRACQSGGPM